MKIKFFGIAVFTAAAMLTTQLSAQQWTTFISGDGTSGYSIEGAQNIDVEKAREMYEQGVPFVDFRSKDSWATGRIPGAIRCETPTQNNFLSIVPMDKSAVFYCSALDCKSAPDAAAMAVEWGFTDIYYFSDGYLAWKAAQLPIETSN